MLLRRLPLETSKEGQQLRLSLDLIKAELKQARNWLATNPTAQPTVLFSDFSSFRQ